VVIYFKHLTADDISDRVEPVRL